MSQQTFKEKFIEELKHSEHDFIKQWFYIGGNRGRHLNKYRTLFGEFPNNIERKNSCICTHHIEEQCYIKNKITEEILVVGNCCINRFICNTDQRCELCKEPHKNRKNNYCNKCRLSRASSICTVGKYKGKTFQYIKQNDISYCTWIMDNENLWGNLLLFQKWLFEDKDGSNEDEDSSNENS